MRDLVCSWLNAENAKIFRSYVKLFKISPHEENYRILIGSCTQAFMNRPIMFLDQDNKTKWVTDSLMREKQISS